MRSVGLATGLEDFASREKIKIKNKLSSLWAKPGWTHQVDAVVPHRLCRFC